MSQVIDAHHHFWQYNPAEYSWIGPNMTMLRRDFLPPDLAAETRAAAVDGVISVQARQSVAETNWLLELARKNDFIRGVVGWAPLIDPDIRRHLDNWRGTKLRAVRHVLQDEPDEYMSREDFNRGIAALKGTGLVYDILIYEQQLPSAIALVDRHPEQIFVLDHIAKPRIAADEIEPWGKHLRELARRSNVYCKISGMATEADWVGWTDSQLQRYFATALETFSPARLMFGSDWPVCLVACGYKRWKELVTQWIAPLSSQEQSRIMGQTAAEAYRLG